MGLEDLVSQVRGVLLKPTNYRVFFASGLNQKDVSLMFSRLNPEETALALQLYNNSFDSSVSSVSEADGEKLLAMCNALFETASNVSSIANAYGAAEDVLIVLHNSPVEEGDLQIVKNQEELGVEFSRNIRNESTLVSRGTYWLKNRRDGIYGVASRNSYSPVEYVTILTTDGSNKKFLQRNLPLLANYSYVMGKDGVVRRQKYGEHNRFIDDSGRDHRADL